MADKKSSDKKSTSKVDTKQDIMQQSALKRGNITEVLNPQGPAKHDMTGFEEDYVDFVDFILRITHRIWEMGDMGYIYDTYQHNCRIHSAYGVSYGVEEVVSGSIAVLAGFPDRRLIGEDVIWKGNNDEGWYSSHLIQNIATNLGYSSWAPPTGKKVRYLAIADVVARNNYIFEEWLVRDTGAMVRQMGLDIFEVAKLVSTSFDQEFSTGETDRLAGQAPPQTYEIRHAPDHPEDVARRVYQDIWNGRRFNLIKELYEENCETHLPNDVTIYSNNHFKAYLLGLIGMFPDFAMSVENVHWNGNEEEGYRVSVRWRFRGTHRHNGWYGKPSGKPVNVLGISHVHIRNGKVWKEFIVFDELALLAQIVDKD